MSIDLFDGAVKAENLFFAWEQFRKGKGDKRDVQEFEYDLERNIFALSRDLTNMTYVHGPYYEFIIRDPKVRNVCKATVRDRIVHHAIFDVLTRAFEPTFISHSFSCRIGKGTHKGVEALERMLREESRNNTRTCYVLKCDVRKFFDTIDHETLLGILGERIKDQRFMWLVRQILSSYQAGHSDLFHPRGVPIGNLTSQIFANIYMGKLDMFMKQVLRVRHYARYTDDFVIVSADRSYLEELIPRIRAFLKEHLALDLHPKKVIIRKYSQGVDFLGYVTLPHAKLVRKRTKNRMLRKLREKMRDLERGLISEESVSRSFQSYLGILSHANAHKLSEHLKNQYLFWRNSY